MGIIGKEYTVCLKKGEDALKAGRYVEAIELFEKVLDLKPGDVSAHLSLSVACLKNGDTEKAIKTSKQLVDIAPKTAYFHFNLGLVYSIAKRFKDAKGEFLKAVKLKRNYPKAYVHLGELYERSGERDKALLCYKKANDVDKVRLLEGRIEEERKSVDVQLDRETASEKATVEEVSVSGREEVDEAGVDEQEVKQGKQLEEETEAQEEKGKKDLDMLVALEEEEAVSVEGKETQKKGAEKAEVVEEKETEEELAKMATMIIPEGQGMVARVEVVEGAPEWMCTFADMMSLLLTFFILLLSFSTIDLLKLKKVVDACQEAFGLEAEHPGLSVPTLKSLKGTVTIDVVDQAADSMQEIKKVIEKFVEDEGFGDSVEVDIDERGIVVQVTDNLVFQRGKAQLLPISLPLLNTLANVMEEYPFQLSVEGHTDDIPIHTMQFPSNWELAASRAGSVIRYFIETLKVDAKRICGVSYADTLPILPNTTDGNRAKNRRVEFVFLKPAAY